MPPSDLQVGKALAGILRWREDVRKDQDGFARLEDIQKFMWFTTDSRQIQQVVATDIHEKKGRRFESKQVNGMLCVRAIPNRTSRRREQAQDGKQQYALPQGAPNMANPYMLHERRGTKGGKGGKGVAASSKGASELRCPGCNIIWRVGHYHQRDCPLGLGGPVQEKEVISDTPGAAPGGEGQGHSVELQELQGRLEEYGLSMNELEVIKDVIPELVNVLGALGYANPLQRVKVLAALSELLG